MKGDFTRDTFDPRKHFSRVLMQQGRVQLDADWNEQTAILLHYLRTLATDMLGPHAGPQDAMGFAIITKETANATTRIDGFEADSTRRDVLKKELEKGNAIIAPGRYYVHGVLVECHRAILYTEQGCEPKLEDIQKWQSGLLAYLDVWERHITYVEDDHIREVALGGPDTCTRAQVVWQVRILFQPQGEIRKDFYAELPIAIRQTGTYHEMGNFASGIAALPRIVTLHDIEIVPVSAKDARAGSPGDLTLNVTAKTYRYLDEEDQAKAGAKEKKGAKKKPAKKG